MLLLEEKVALLFLLLGGGKGVQSFRDPTLLLSIMAFVARSTLWSMVPAFFGMLLGIAIGVSFMRFGAMSNMNVFLNQQQLADAKVEPPVHL